MIRPICWGTLIVVGTTLLQSALSERGNAGPREQQLPGARPAIDASEFPSLRAALDALPDEGGVVRIPPWTFDVSEPLVLTCMQDVLIEGAGTATHIRNVNTEGEPALVIRAKEATDGDDIRQWRIHLSNFRVTGNEQSGHGIVAERANELYVEGVTVSYHAGDGLRLDHC